MRDLQTGGVCTASSLYLSIFAYQETLDGHALVLFSISTSEPWGINTTLVSLNSLLSNVMQLDIFIFQH